MTDKHIIVGFSTDKQDFISKVIRLLTWSRFSHVVLISPDKKSYIESTHGAGVRELPIEAFLKKDGVEFGTIYHPDPDKVWQLAKQEIGKPYDSLYIYGWLCRRNWQDDASWACCELVPAMAVRAGHPIIREDCFIKITPELLYQTSTPYEGIQ
ncbi:MAG: hypothetical protein CVU54_01890 [Deltaproteobacteria bacterium HGW-Deltaproteobacteria-12]|jgi:uncharacterized protein YycO|nr:MAG: hypothetical protein CVU54_01890 [Deltaproteobacteria bacterium HGW-Deltaproteobacteria-12]